MDRHLSPVAIEAQHGKLFPKTFKLKFWAHIIWIKWRWGIGNVMPAYPDTDISWLNAKKALRTWYDLQRHHPGEQNRKDECYGVDPTDGLTRSNIIFSRLVLTRRPVLSIYVYWLFVYYLAILNITK